MCRFIETIRIVNGEVMGLEYHQNRVDRTLKHEGALQVSLVLQPLLADRPACLGVVKARIVYDTLGMVHDKSYTPYSIRDIHTLQLVADDGIEYDCKREDRSRLNALSAQKGEADEVIIVKEGRLTDTSYSNIALYDGHQWFTPEHPLLCGTMRQRLIDEGQLLESDIRMQDLTRFEKVSLINAMMPLGECTVKAENVLWLK